jgi:alcohol dehydrogenase
MEARKIVSPEFVFGEGALELVGRYAVNLGANKALLVTDPGVIQAGWASQVKQLLERHGIAFAVFSELTPNPRETHVMRGADFYRDEQCDVIVAVGGGSSIDCAKGIGIVASNNRNILEFEGVDRIPIPGPPLICIPTTSGSSADISQFDIINDSVRKKKVAIISKATIPDVALIDPVTTTTMPPLLTAATGMDALVHAIEAYVSLASSAITDLYALEAIRLVRANLEAAIENPNEIKAREQMSLASLLAGLAFSNASLGLVHAMAHALGGWLDLPHGECNAILLCSVVAFNFASAPERYRRAAAAFGVSLEGCSDSAAKERIVTELNAFRSRVGLGCSLTHYGVSHGSLQQLARHAYDDPCLATNPVQPSAEDIEKIYERSLSE